MSQQQASRPVCEHEIVPGVACDGLIGRYPARDSHIQHHQRLVAYAVMIDSLTGEKDFDCVKGIG